MIRAIIAQIFIPNEELVMPTVISTNEANTEIKTQLVIVEARISKFST